MKLVVLSESPEDEAAARILVDGILGIQTKLVAPPSLRARGWPQVLNVLPAVLRQLHYHTDADGLVVIVDSDGSTPHQLTHVPSNDAAQGCRVCKLRLVADQVQNGLTQVPNRAPLKTAFGLAIPALEAWLLCGVDPSAIEAAYIQRPDAAKQHLRLQLKRDVYGTDRPSREVRMKRMTEEAMRLVQILDEFERLFPNGFGAFARDIRSW
ncbi:MAG TPA: hypothetical protein VN687_16670 [Blastocatellia bacterium]|nr:hypothetical protein [Blastocatellia bacterium]